MLEIKYFMKKIYISSKIIIYFFKVDFLIQFM